MKRYRIISELGKGATGVVYRAMRVEDGVTVALKKLVLPGHLDAKQEEEFIARFKSEAQAALSIAHPGVVKALDCGLDEGTFYIAYELIEGVTLEEAQRSGRKFSPEEVADILVQAADALGFAHNLGVVHRDISPGNIFLGNDGKVRISDFGVARFTGHAGAGVDDAIVGTPGYMAPEQVTGGDVDPRSDIFSLGCVAYELLAGKPPFIGDNIAQVIHQVLHVQPKPVREIDPKVPLPLEELIFRMLAKNASYRYQSMAEVKTAAERVMETIPRQAKTASAEDAGHAPYLLVVEGPQKGRKFDLLPSVTTIGRVVGDVLLPDDADIANQHAWITRDENAWVLYDADSKTGTYVNGEQISREEILAGDLIKIGGTVLEFRGAGGHSGAFQEPVPANVEQDQPKEKQKAAKKKKQAIPWLPVVIIAVPSAVVIAALVVFGIVIPARYIGVLNAATEPRWEAFSGIAQGTVGDADWTSKASDIVSQWQNPPMPESAQFYAPAWVFGSQRINAEADYRFLLFSLANKFLKSAIEVAPANPEGVADAGALSNAYSAVAGLEPMVEGIEAPSGTSPIWVGRKNQLLGLIRTWKASAGPTVENGAQAPLGFKQERDQARENLLTGWFTLRDAGSNLAVLEQAFNQFELCRQTMSTILDARPREADASSMRGLAEFLAARVENQYADAGHADRYDRAKTYLTSAEADIANSDNQAWSRAIPPDLTGQFPSPASVKAQINALRTLIDASIAQPSSGQGTPSVAPPEQGGF